MKFPLRLRLRFNAQIHRTSPAAFRRLLKLSPDDPTPFTILMQDWQRNDFEALDDAWLRLAGEAVEPKYRRAYIERPRGHSKTLDMAVQIAWIILCSPHFVHGLAAAADRDQAALIRNSVQNIARLNPELCADLDIQRHAVINPATGSKLEIISSDVQSSWGALPDFVICDELCHWEKPDLWFSLFSSAAKRPNCVLAVLTNAGVGRGWQWNIREAARTRSTWYFSSLDGPQAPWIGQEWLNEQEALLPRPVFDRLWRNIWQHSDGEFVTLAEAEACRDDTLTICEQSQPHLQYIAAIDYAEKHDFTVGVVIHRDGSRIIVDRMDVVEPTPDAPVKVAWVEDWIKRVAADFHAVTFIVDEYQLVGTIQRFERTYDIRRFEFLSGRGNHALAVNLRKLILNREITWYPGCGELTSRSDRDDLETELASLVLKQSASGRCRFDHLRDGIHHDDRAFALGAACLHAVGNPTEQDWLEITPPSRTGGFNF